jgi:uncharacterized membrane protein
MMFPIFLSVVNWIHLFATVVWIGGMTTNLFVVLPSIRETLEPGVMGKLMGAVMKRFRVWIYISIVLLVLTGFGMMRFNMNYLGFAQFGNVWSVVSLIKHVVILVMIIMSVYAFEGLARKVVKVAIKGPSDDLTRLQKKQISLAATGFILGLIVLLLTGIMGAISVTS